jgi:hypothetical protein
MDNLADQLRNEETSVLQAKLRTNGYIEEAAEIARKLLRERGAAIPEPQTNEETELDTRKVLKRSNAKFIATVLWVVSVWLFKLYEPEKRAVFFGTGLALAAVLGLYKVR